MYSCDANEKSDGFTVLFFVTFREDVSADATRGKVPVRKTKLKSLSILLCFGGFAQTKMVKCLEAFDCNNGKGHGVFSFHYCGIIVFVLYDFLK